MTSSTNKGNISTLLFTLACIACIAFVTALARLMIGDGLKSGKYTNPNVATKVVGGTIYDSNGRILAMDVPVYNVYMDKDISQSSTAVQVLSLHLDMTPDEIASRILDPANERRTSDGDSLILIARDIEQSDIPAFEDDLDRNALTGFVSIKREYSRTYPTAFHCAQLISDIEKVYRDYLFPTPEFGVSTTYGCDIHLSIDLDVQYLLDLVVQQVYELQSPDWVSAGIVDVKTSRLIACTTYPFYDLNQMDDEGDGLSNLSFATEFETVDAMIGNIHVVDSATNHRTGADVDIDDLHGMLSNEESGLDKAIGEADGSSATAVLIPSDEPRFAVYICSHSPRYYDTNSMVLEDAVAALVEGLSSQGRL